MFEKLFGRRKTHPAPETILSMTALGATSENENEKLFSMAELSTANANETRVAKIAPKEDTLYEKIVYKLDILIPTQKKEEEILIPPGGYLQKVLYGKFKKLRVLKDPNWGLPLMLYEPKEGIETYRVMKEREEGAITMLDPTSPFVRKWDNFSLVLLLFTASVTPYEVAFIPSNSNIDMLFLINRAVDLCFLYDMTIQVRTPVRDVETGRLISNFGEVSVRYLKSWFSIDFLSIFPFEFINAGDSGSNLALLRLLRLARLLKLLRVLRASRKLQRIRVNLKMRYTRIQLWTFIVILVFMIHWLACGYRIASERTAPTDQFGWADTYALSKNKTIVEIPGSELYLLSLYWSSLTLTLIGSSLSAVQPLTGVEWGFTIFACLSGYAITINIISNLTDLYVHANKASRIHELKVDSYLEMFDSLFLPPQIKFKVHEYLTDQFALQKQSSYQGLIKELPQQWNGIINLEIFLPFLNRIPFLEPFIDVEPGVMIDICRRVEMLAIPPNGFVFQGGIKGIYIIERGIVSIDGEIYVRGDIFGETVLRINNKKNEGRALTNVTIQFLSREDLEACMAKHRRLRYYARRWTSWELVRRYIRTYCKLYKLAALRGGLMHPPLVSRRGEMDGSEYDDIDLAVMEHMDEYGYF